MHDQRSVHAHRCRISIDRIGDYQHRGERNTLNPDNGHRGRTGTDDHCFAHEPDLWLAKGWHLQCAANCDFDQHRQYSVPDRIQTTAWHQQQQLLEKRHLWWDLTTWPTMHDDGGVYTQRRRGINRSVRDHRYRP